MLSQLFCIFGCTLLVMLNLVVRASAPFGLDNQKVRRCKNRMVGGGG